MLNFVIAIHILWGLFAMFEYSILLLETPENRAIWLASSFHRRLVLFRVVPVIIVSHIYFLSN